MAADGHAAQMAMRAAMRRATAGGAASLTRRLRLQKRSASRDHAQARPPPSSPLDRTLDECVAQPCSVSWWGPAVLGISDAAGTVALAQLPGYLNVLGAEPVQCSRGSYICSVPADSLTGVAAAAATPIAQRGVFVLEPILASAEAGAATDAVGVSNSGGTRQGRLGRQGSDGAAAAVVLPTAGWRLLMLAERTAEEMMQVFIADENWGSAFQVARAYSLDADAVYAARWASRPVDSGNINDNLAKMTDRRWVAAQCQQRLAPDYESQRRLINYGLKESAKRCPKPPAAGSGPAAAAAAAAGGGPSSVAGGDTLLGEDESAQSSTGAEEDMDGAEARWWRAVRLTLWRHSDRLELLYLAQGRTFDATAFQELRALPLKQLAEDWAHAGHVTALLTLVSHYPASLSRGAPLLRVLDALPETLDPRMYSALLPKSRGSPDPRTSASPPCPPTGSWHTQQPGPAPAPAHPTPCPAHSSPDLPQPSGEASLPVAPVRKVDWLEVGDTLGRLEAAGQRELCSATDPLVRLQLAGSGAAPQLTKEQVAEWYCTRALAIDACSGQLQAAAALLELGQQRGVSGRVPELLWLARSLASVVHSGGGGGGGHREHPSSGGRQGGSATGMGGVAGEQAFWQRGLQEFSELSGQAQLRLLLRGGQEQTLDQDIEERVLPFLDGLAPSSASTLLDGLLAAELGDRPAWCVALVRLETELPRLYSTMDKLVHAAITGILQSARTDTWESFDGMLSTLDLTLDSQLTALQQPSHADGGSGGGDEAHTLELLLGGVREVRGFVAAGRLLCKHGLPLTVQSIKDCGVDEAGGIFRQLLVWAQKSGRKWTDAQWTLLWVDLREVQASGLPCFPLEEAMALFCRALLFTGKLSLANSYLRGTGSVRFSTERVELLVVGVAEEVLMSASSMEDKAVVQAASVLALAPAASADASAAGPAGGDPPSRQLRSFIQALQLLPSFGLTLLPAQVQQMPSRLDVIRAVLRHAAIAAAAAAAASTAVASVAAALDHGATAATLSGAEAAAGDPRSPSNGGGGGGLGTVAAAVVSAAVGRVRAAATERGGGSSAGAGAAAVHRQLERLLELAALLGLDSSHDVLQVTTLAATAAYAALDLHWAQETALQLVACSHIPAARLAACLGIDKRVADASARRTLLAFALAHCAVTPAGSVIRLPSSEAGPGSDDGDGLVAVPMRELLQELQSCEQCCVAESAGVLLDAGPEYHLARALLQPAAPQHHPTAALPSMGDVPLAVHVLLSQPRPQDSVSLLTGLTAHTSYAQLQRLLAVGVYSNCLRVLLPVTAAGPGAEAAPVAADGAAEPISLRQALLCKPLEELLQLARAHIAATTTTAATSTTTTTATATILTAHSPPAAPAKKPPNQNQNQHQKLPNQNQHQQQQPAARAPVSATARAVDPGAGAEGREALAAAEQLLGLLAAARDARSMRQHQPGVDASQFCSGDAAYQREVILEQAALAGRQSGSGSSAAAGASLLGAASAMGKTYQIDPWDITMAFVSALVVSAPSITPELKTLVLSHERQLLQQPRKLLSHLAASTFPALPPAGAAHTAFLVSLMVDAINALGKVGPHPAGMTRHPAPHDDATPRPPR
ncbi:MAG: hypothetical protein WDW36_005253 [Sanguina aurantia]